MGFIYTKDGKLCCDICGNYPATKKPCKYGYCQPYALCKACREDTVKMTKLNDYHGWRPVWRSGRLHPAIRWSSW